MQNFAKDIRLDHIIPNLKAGDKEKAFQAIAEQVAPLCGVTTEGLFNKLIQREAQASSGIGDGVAIPHVKFQRLEKPFVTLIRLGHPIAFNALDDAPVDIICLVLSQESEGPVYLRRLSRITRMLRNEDLRRSLRDAKDEDSIRIVMSDSSEWMIAA